MKFTRLYIDRKDIIEAPMKIEKLPINLFRHFPIVKPNIVNMKLKIEKVA